jgi:hypothetical protein
MSIFFSWNVLLIWVFWISLFFFFVFFTAGGYPESFLMLLFVVFGAISFSCWIYWQGLTDLDAMLISA